MNIIIVNPKAGFGKAQKLIKKVQKDSLYRDKNCRTFFTEYAGHAEKIAGQVVRIHQETLSCILVIGGDGTLHEVINGTKTRPSLPIGFIPAGSGNDFGRGIGLENKGVALFRKMINNPGRLHCNQGVFVPTLNCQWEKRYFANSIGFGFDGEIVALANRPKFRKWMRRVQLHKYTYTIALLRLLRRYNPISFELNLDGEVRKYSNALMVTVTNHPYYGGGMKITPQMDIRNSGFQVLVIEQISKWKILALFFTVFLGLHTKLKEVKVFEVETVKINSHETMSYQVDGQSGECKECEIRKSSRKRTFLSG
ncbi:diacylglycerol/lipid kinase family protein [Halobacillus mangrovi]|uniref:diacylglycerol/lipid kinase family protein n=1 Tax=Halobacillus mangrovi TaxID=402384 RepID=UPI003D986948